MADFRLGTPVIRADFNSASQAGVLFASSRFLQSAFQALEVGIEILVRDDEGNSCRGVVTSIEGMAVRIELSWSTWQSEDERRPVVDGAAGNGITATVNEPVSAASARYRLAASSTSALRAPSPCQLLPPLSSSSNSSTGVAA